jgi:hypothetical protein
MPHLHLPIDHTEDDLVLAANVAEVVGSEDLYVVWSHEGGAGAVPEVNAVLRDARPPKPLGRLRAAVAALLRAIFRRPARDALAPAHGTDRPRLTSRN